MNVQPTVEPIKGGYHALSRELNLAVRGETEEEARQMFALAVEKAAEIRARPRATAPEGDGA